MTTGISKKLYVLFAVAVVMLLAGFGWPLLRPQEPVCQGKRLSAWLYEVWYLDGGVDPEKACCASTAVSSTKTAWCR
jgi:hypothetical protein